MGFKSAATFLIRRIIRSGLFRDSLAGLWKTKVPAVSSSKIQFTPENSSHHSRTINLKNNFITKRVPFSDADSLWMSFLWSMYGYPNGFLIKSSMIRLPEGGLLFSSAKPSGSNGQLPKEAFLKSTKSTGSRCQAPAGPVVSPIKVKDRENWLIRFHGRLSFRGLQGKGQTLFRG